MAIYGLIGVTPKANKNAYALGRTRWMNGDMNCTCEEFMAAIDEVISYAAAECPACAKIRNEFRKPKDENIPRT